LSFAWGGREWGDLFEKSCSIISVMARKLQG
jgi:hypothetical protein